VGAWESGPFDNDDALDFVGTLADAPDDETHRRLLEALTLSEGYLELPEANEAIAAAGLVAAWNGWPVDAGSVLDLVDSRELEVTDALRSAARAALDQVQGEDSEWREVWDDAGLLDEVGTQLDEMRAHL
jgi:hypothetical protein